MTARLPMPRLVTKVTAANRPKISSDAFKVAQRLGIFGFKEISAEMSITMDQAVIIINGWVEIGKCFEIERGAAYRRQYQVAPEFAAPVPVLNADLKYQRMWNGMRGLRQFTPTDIAAHAGSDVGVTRAEASAYCQALLQGGYLVVERTAKPPSREAAYRLIQNTGPLPPRERRVVALFDDNLGVDPVYVRTGAK